MKKWYRAAPVLLGVIVMLAAACTPPTGGGGGPANIKPVAVATASTTSGNVPLSVAFDGSDSTDSDGTIASYSWAFGNATSGTGVTASATYTAGGTYTAVLTVTDDKGATDTDSITITVNGDGDGDGYFPPADCNDADASINPGAPDAAGDEIDQNCDGIDGEQNDAIFVNGATGANTSSCGTILEPCQSIDAGQNRAVDTGRPSVFVAGGTYSKFTVQAGLEIRGGYGQNWQRGVLATSPVTATVNASFDASVGGPVALLATGISTPTRVADLKIAGAAAGAGQNSYGVVVRNSTSALVLDSLNVVGGTAGKGANGANGSGGWATGANGGFTGGDGVEPGGCNTTTAGGGGSGGSGINNGGGGGKGGVIDGNCFLGVCTSCDAKPGLNGTVGNGPGGGFAGGGGAAGTSGVPGICNIQGNVAVNGGGGGNGANGSAGTAGGGGASGAAGSAGNLGSNGAGGGGGGGGGGADCGVDDAGAGGGGGGAGGARAATAGAGGAAGLQSIGIRIENSSPILTGIQITLGTGGEGGNGGAGAAGQPGGAGGNGGAPKDRGGAGGNGGAGGTGGASAAGGGGGGGSAIGLSRNAASSPTGSPSFSGGAGGAGGAGGNTGAAGTVVNSVVA